MKQIMLVGLFFGLILTGCSQTAETIEFVNYDKVIEDIFSSASLTDLENKWDYESILLLDSTSIDRINKIRPDIVEDFRRNLSSSILEKYKKKISTDVKSIRDCFEDERIKNRILTVTSLEADLSYKKLKLPIYIKDDKSAVYQIYGESWSECNRVTLTDKGLLIETIYIIQE